MNLRPHQNGGSWNSAWVAGSTGRASKGTGVIMGHDMSKCPKVGGS